MGIYKFLYLRKGEMISNFSIVKTFKIHYFVIQNKFQVNLEQSTQE